MISFQRNKRSYFVFAAVVGAAAISVLFQNCSVSQFDSLGSTDLPSHMSLRSTSSGSSPATGLYEVVPQLTSPNLGVHFGAVVDNQPAVDRLINIDPTSPDVKESGWFLTQWKKKSPLKLNQERQDPIITNSSYRDGYLGKPLFEINSPGDPQFGVETSLLIYNDPIDQSKVFEIIGRNGYINKYGGSNVFLTGALEHRDRAIFSNDLSLTFKSKISRLNRKSFGSTDPDAIAIGSIFTGFTAYNTETKDSIFIQISHADTRNWFSEHRDCYVHGQNLEIVYGYNLDGDFAGVADPANAPLKERKYSLNRYLCAAIKQNFNCPTGLSSDRFPSLRKDLSKWVFGGIYTGVETQVARGSVSSPDSPGVSFGEIEAGIQYSNLKVTANTNKTFQSCDDVERQFSAVSTNAPAKSSCNVGTFKDGAGNTVQFSCNCGEVPGANKQADGCYHKIIAPPARTPAEEVSCRQGSFQNGSQTVDFFCHCGSIPGGVLQNDGCYHRAR